MDTGFFVLMGIAGLLVVISVIAGFVKGEKWPFTFLLALILYAALYGWFYYKIVHLPEDMWDAIVKTHRGE